MLSKFNEMSLWKKFAISFAVLLAVFVAGSVQQAHAYPGYFTGANFGGPGHDLAHNFVGVNDAGTFTSHMWACLNSAPPCSSMNGQIAASYIILTMLGDGNHSVGQAFARFSAWQNIVNQYAAAGRINFNALYGYSLNTMMVPAGSPYDVVQYPEGATANPSIVFYNPDGSTYAIKKDCANPVGNLSALQGLSTGYSGFAIDVDTGIPINMVAEGAMVHLYGPGGGGTQSNPYGYNSVSPGWHDIAMTISPGSAFEIVGSTICNGSCWGLHLIGGPGWQAGTFRTWDFQAGNGANGWWLVRRKPASMQGFFIAQDTGIVLPGTVSISGVGSNSSVPFSIGGIPAGVRTFTAGGTPAGFLVAGSNICRNGGSQPGIPACTPGQPSSSSGGAGWAAGSVRNVDWQAGVNYDVRWVLQPDVTCGGIQLSPQIIDVQTPAITVTATFSFGSGQAASVASSMSGGQADFAITGPVNRSGQGPLALSGNTLTATRTFSPALGVAGLYTFTSQLRGVLAGACTNTRDIEVGYNPVFTVRNGDSQVGMGLQPVGSTTCTADTHAGIVSWNQGAGNYSGAGTNLGAMALSYIQGFVTNSNVALAQGPGTLAFANNAPIASGDVRYGGKFAAYQSDCMKDYYATKPASAVSGGGGIAITDDGAYSTNGTRTINGGTVGRGKHVAIYVDGNVNITGNIQFQAGPYTNTGDIPALWIIATGNIYIRGDVQRIDAVLVAQGKNGVADSGAVYTCAQPNSSFNPATDSYNFNQCDDFPLVVNGSVIARRLVLLRSYGTISEAPGKYAETFNYTPLVWLGWTPTNQTTNSTQSIGGSYDAITSLPPVL